MTEEIPKQPRDETPQVYTSKAGSAIIVWVLANSKKPLTNKELAEELDARTKSVAQNVRKLFRRGVLVRRKRATFGKGTDPYEYHVAQRDVTVDEER